MVDTDRKGMYLSVVSTPQHPVDIVPRQKLVNKALWTILDLKLSEIKGDLPLGGRTRFFRHNWEKITQDFQVLEAITGYKQGNQRWQTSPAAPPGWVGTLSHGNVHVKFHDDRLRNGGDITY